MRLVRLAALALGLLAGAAQADPIRLDADDATLTALAAVDSDVAQFAMLARNGSDAWDSGVIALRGLSAEQVGRAIRRERVDAAGEVRNVKLAFQLLPDGQLLRVRLTPFELQPGPQRIVDLEYRRQEADRMVLTGWKTH